MKAKDLDRYLQFLFDVDGQCAHACCNVCSNVSSPGNSGGLYCHKIKKYFSLTHAKQERFCIDFESMADWIVDLEAVNS